MKDDTRPEKGFKVKNLHLSLKGVYMSADVDELMAIGVGMLWLSFIALDEYLWQNFIEYSILRFGLSSQPVGLGTGYYLFFLWRMS